MLMHTYTGKQINPLAITQEDIEIKDIAHALSLLCRGGGHLKYFLLSCTAFFKLCS